MKMEHVVRMAMKGCFAEQLVVRPIPLTGTVQLQSKWPSCSRFQDPDDLLRRRDFDRILVQPLVVHGGGRDQRELVRGDAYIRQAVAAC